MQLIMVIIVLIFAASLSIFVAPLILYVAPLGLLGLLISFLAHSGLKDPSTDKRCCDCTLLYRLELIKVSEIDLVMIFREQPQRR